MSIELLAPAGDLKSAFTAISFGADAIYLGIDSLSARKDCGISIDDLKKIITYAKTNTKRVKIYVALNIVFKDSEFLKIVEILSKLYVLKVDAVIIQDLGLYFIVKKYFPIALHASTQMAIHNFWGARFLKKIGFDRVVLAREMELFEIKKCVDEKIEVEAFIHGALCYSYSGLCYLSSVLFSKSGNKGECLQPCRHEYFLGTDTEKSRLFSLKDFHLGDKVKELEEIGVVSAKIEGRKKDYTYVGAVTNYYRQIIDKSSILSPTTKKELKELQNDLRFVFSRESTDFYLGDKSDSFFETKAQTRSGVLVGKVLNVLNINKRLVIEFKAFEDICVRDGLLIEGKNKVGFSISQLFLVQGSNEKKVTDAKKEQTVRVVIPNAQVSKGDLIFCVSKNSLQTKYQPIKRQLQTDNKVLPYAICLEIKEHEVVANIKLSYLSTKISFLEKKECEFFRADNQNLNQDEKIKEIFFKGSESGFFAERVEVINKENILVQLGIIKELRKMIHHSLELKVADLLSVIAREVSQSLSLNHTGNTGLIFLKINDILNIKEIILKTNGKVEKYLFDLDIFDAKILEFVDAKNIIISLPPILQSVQEDLVLKKISTVLNYGIIDFEYNNLGIIEFFLHHFKDRKIVWHAGPFLNVINSASIKMLNQFYPETISLSYESDEDVVASLKKSRDKLILPLYFYPICFTSKNCPTQNKGCDRRSRTKACKTVVNDEYVLESNCTSTTLTLKKATNKNGLILSRTDFYGYRIEVNSLCDIETVMDENSIVHQ